MAKPACPCWGEGAALADAAQSWLTRTGQLLGFCTLDIQRPTYTVEAGTEDWPFDSFLAAIFANKTCLLLTSVDEVPDPPVSENTSGGMTAACRNDIKRLCDAIDGIVP